jgi:prepilin-type N-terminal cleavage/methylation domain-containing protein
MKTQGGFTLIELLIVIAILAVLFGITALALNGIGANAGQVTQDAEKDIVQSAFDIYMTTHVNVTANPGPAVQVGSFTPEFGVYLRRSSKYGYTWDANGVILTQVALP